MHVVVNGRRAGSVYMPRVEHCGQEETPERRFVKKPARLRSDFGSPSVTPVTSPDGVSTHQNRRLDTDQTSQHVFTHSTSVGTSLQARTHGESLTPGDRSVPVPRHSLPPSRLRSPARRGEARNLADDLNVEALDKPLHAGANENTEALRSHNADLRKQLDEAMVLLATKRLTLRMLSSPARADPDRPLSKPASLVQTCTASSGGVHSDPSGTVAHGGASSAHMHSDLKAKKVNRARLKRSMLLARGLGTTRLELKQLRDDVVSAQKQMAHEIDAVVAQVSSAVTQAGSRRGDTVVSTTEQMKRFMDMQLSVATMLRELVVGLPGWQLSGMQLPAPSLSTAAVGEWLSSLGMAEHAVAFADHDIDGRALVELTDTQLRDDLRVLKVGHRNAILAARRGLLRNGHIASRHQTDGRRFPDGVRAGEGRKSSFFRPPRLQLATSLTRTPRSKLLSRASKAKLNARLAALSGHAETATERQQRQSRASTMLLDLVGESCSDAGSSIDSAVSTCVSVSEDRYSDDFDAISLSTADMECESARSSPEKGRLSSDWQAWGAMSNDGDSNTEIAEEVDGEATYESDFERLSSASSLPDFETDPRRQEEHSDARSDDSPTTKALKDDFLAGIISTETSVEEVDRGAEDTDADADTFDDTSPWSRLSDSSTVDLVATPRRGDNLHLTTLSTRSYSDDEEDEEQSDAVLAQGDTLPADEAELGVEPEPDELATNSFALPSGQAVAVCTDIFRQLQPDAGLWI